MLYKDVIQGDLWFGDGKLGTLMLIIFAQSIVASFLSFFKFSYLSFCFNFVSL